MWKISWQNLMMYSKSVETSMDPEDNKPAMTMDDLEIMINTKPHG
jgi:hypothetical protein